MLVNILVETVMQFFFLYDSLMNKVQKKSFFCYKNWPWTHFLTV